MLERVRTVRQIRQYTGEDVPDDVLGKILDVARWTGSSRNTQPWRFIVVRDRTRLATLSKLRPAINWVATAPVGIAIVLDEGGTSTAFDEGRVTERILIAARELGYGAGVAWFLDREPDAKRVLEIPEDKVAHQIVMIGRAVSAKDPRPNPRPGGRKPLSELVSYDRWGGTKR